MFLLVPADLGSPGQRAVKRLLLLLYIWHTPVCEMLAVCKQMYFHIITGVSAELCIYVYIQAVSLRLRPVEDGELYWPLTI